MTSDVYEVTVHRPYAFLEQQCHEVFRFQIFQIMCRCKVCFIDRELTIKNFPLRTEPVRFPYNPIHISCVQEFHTFSRK